MAELRLFASARDAAGVDRASFDAPTVGDLLHQAAARYGAAFTAVLARSRVWVNGEPAEAGTAIGAGDEVAVLPPVSGGAVDAVGGVAIPGPEGRTEASPPPAAPAGKRRRAPTRSSPGGRTPSVRLGLAWAVLVFSVAAIGRPWLGLLFGFTAALAAVQVVRARRRGPGRPIIGAAVGGAFVLPLAAIFGAVPLGLAVAGVAGGAVGARARRWSPAAAAEVRISLLVALPIGLAAAAPVLVRQLGLVEPLVLLALAGAHDVGCYLVGTGARSSWEGPAAGVASLVPVTLFAAVLLVPKFPEWAPFLLGGLAAVLGPAGPPLAARLLGDPDARAPALRRLDSLLVLGPAWAVAALVIAR